MRQEITHNKLKFILGGRAEFTITNEATGHSEDFTVVLEKTLGKYYVTSAVGTHLGTIHKDKILYPERTVTPVVQQLASYKGFWWYYRQVVIAEYDHPSCTEQDNNLAYAMDFKLYHKGRCSKCGRELTDKDSIARGMGPVCSSYKIEEL